MNAIRRIACASSGGSITWPSIDWAECERTVSKLQARIVKATKEGRWGKVKALQWLLTHSLSGKALAVRRVTENQGKRTPGIDGEIWKTPATKTRAMASLGARLSPATAEAGLYPEIERKAKASRHTDDEGPSDAGPTPARPRPGIRNDGGRKLLRISQRTRSTRRTGTVLYRDGSTRKAGMGSGSRHQRMLRQHQP